MFIYNIKKTCYQKTVQFPFVQLPSHLMKYLTENTTVTMDKMDKILFCAKTIAEANKWYVPNHGTLPLKHRKRNQYPIILQFPQIHVLHIIILNSNILYSIVPLSSSQILLWSEFAVFGFFSTIRRLKTYQGLIRFVPLDLQNKPLKSCLIFFHKLSLVPRPCKKEKQN